MVVKKSLQFHALHDPKEPNRITVIQDGNIVVFDGVAKNAEVRLDYPNRINITFDDKNPKNPDPTDLPFESGKLFEHQSKIFVSRHVDPFRSYDDAMHALRIGLRVETPNPKGRWQEIEIRERESDKTVVFTDTLSAITFYVGRQFRIIPLQTDATTPPGSG